MFSSLVSHGVVTDDLAFIVCSMTPILKRNNSSCTASASYRAITLSSILGKLFHRILLDPFPHLMCNMNVRKSILQLCVRKF